MDGPASLEDIKDRLFRDNPDTVTAIYRQERERRDSSILDLDRSLFASHGNRTKGRSTTAKPSSAKKLKQSKKHVLATKGMTVAEMAKLSDVWGVVSPSPEALRRLLIHHGWLDTAPYGRDQSRTLATRKTIEGGYGWNVDPSSKHSIKISGGNRSFPFPVFVKDRLPEVVASLGWPEIISVKQATNCTKAAARKQALATLIAEYSYLPNRTLAELSGMGIASVERYRAVQGRNFTSPHH